MHFTLVMAELQSHLKAIGEMSKEFVLITLSKLFSTYAPQCIPFVWLTLAGLRSVVGQVRSGQILRIACAGECRPQSRGSRDSPCTSPCCRLSQAPFSHTHFF
ncbi:maestro heat-like repeat-containing protein family member 2A [Meleagris gallopavo]|uniref:maestro heat-like repeat-containing protein family member 2A n=1 Tax=Meleagris gallopavo TaxID=9103 RepID=UPI0012AC120D|nr:maestro heat-like repeat-containing protein family member 2A [Meleagris gallopavo]